MKYALTTLHSRSVLNSCLPQNVREQRDPHSPDDAPVYRQVGRVVWTFQLEWTPGGDDPEDPIPPDSQPWWATTPEAHPDSEAGAVMEVPYTLLPLYLHAPHCASAISPAEVPCTGWHCRQCGRLNVQRNLSFQRCAKCSVGALSCLSRTLLTPHSRPMACPPSAWTTCAITTGRHRLHSRRIVIPQPLFPRPRKAWGIRASSPISSTTTPTRWCAMSSRAIVPVCRTRPPPSSTNYRRIWRSQ